MGFVTERARARKTTLDASARRHTRDVYFTIKGLRAYCGGEYAFARENQARGNFLFRVSSILNPRFPTDLDAIG